MYMGDPENRSIWVVGGPEIGVGRTPNLGRVYEPRTALEQKSFDTAFRDRSY
jgi:hypothetical protein